MKILWIIAIGVTLSSSSLAQVPFRVCSYNVLNFSDDDGDRLPHIQTVMDEIQPDILLVQEVINAAGCESLLTALGPLSGVFASAPFINGPDMDNALLYRRSIITLISQQQISTDLRVHSE